MKYIYEVETRFYFKDKKEACEALPFLDSCLDLETEWVTFHFGLELFRKDIILRISDTRINNQRIITLGYKEPDIEESINIRKEYDEKIDNGIHESEILSILGGKVSLASLDEVKKELKRLGHNEFMSFRGNNIMGKYKLLGLHLKLMHCSSLEYPLLLEIEKQARTLEEASRCKDEIMDFVSKYGLEDRLLKKEPTTLLYETLL